MSSSHIFTWWCLTRGACFSVLQLTAHTHPMLWARSKLCVFMALPWLQAPILGLILRQSQQQDTGREAIVTSAIITLVCSGCSGWAGLTQHFY